MVVSFAGQLTPPAICHEPCLSDDDAPGVMFGPEFDLEPIPTRANVYPTITFEPNLAGSAAVGPRFIDPRFRFRPGGGQA